MAHLTIAALIAPSRKPGGLSRAACRAFYPWPIGRILQFFCVLPWKIRDYFPIQVRGFINDIWIIESIGAPKRHSFLRILKGFWIISEKHPNKTAPKSPYSEGIISQLNNFQDFSDPGGSKRHRNVRIVRESDRNLNNFIYFPIQGGQSGIEMSV